MTDVAILQSLEFVTPYEFKANNKHRYLVSIGVFCVTLPDWALQPSRGEYILLTLGAVVQSPPHTTPIFSRDELQKS